MTVSVVIPTRNEAAWIEPNLRQLSSIAAIREIVVADANSSDETRTIAEKYGCRVTAGGKPGVGRNRGREQASADLIIFLDADTYIDQQSIISAANALTGDRNLAAVNFRVKPLGRNPIDHAAYLVASIYIRIMSHIGIGLGLGNALIVKASDFDSVCGFDENIEVGEDADLFFRLRRSGRRTRLLPKSIAWTSPRRFKAEGRLRFFAKVLLWTALRSIGSRATVIPYSWPAYPTEWATADLRDLTRRGGQIR